MPVFRRRKAQPVAVEEPIAAPTLPDGPAPRADGLIALGDHVNYLLSLVKPLPPFGMALVDAWGLALCEKITADAAFLPEGAEEGAVPLPGVGEHSVLAEEGRVVDSRLIGLLAGVGVDKVMARPRPRVVVIGVGTSLVEPGERLTGPDQSFDAALHMVAAAARAAGVQVFKVPTHTDDPDALRTVISDQLIRADVVLTVGGFENAGDLVPQVFADLGPSCVVQTAMHPGRLQGFALAGDEQVPIIPLSADPGSAYVTFEAVGRPIIHRLMGIQDVSNPQVRCVAEQVLRSRAGIVEFVPAQVREDVGRHLLQPLQNPDVDWLVRLAQANALAVLGEDVEFVEAGRTVPCWDLGHD